MPIQDRTAMLIGREGVEKLSRAHVAVFGIGGVGGAVCEALARAGVGVLSLFDDDVVNETNINRQIVALHSTLGQKKAEVMAQRILDINPACKVHTHEVFYTPQNAQQYPLDEYDYVVDAIDTVSAKIELICRAQNANVPVISAMGAGNKLYPERFEVCSLADTSVCPLARVMRKELKKRDIKNVKVVYSKEEPVVPVQTPQAAGAQEETAGLDRPGTPKNNSPGSISFVPGTAGFVMAGAVVRDLLKG